MNQQFAIEIIRYLIPIITFVTGVLLIPRIERIKGKAKARDTYENLKIELNDEIEELPNRIKKMAECLDTISRFESKKEIPPGKICWYVPRETKCHFLKDLMETSFRILSKEQRYSAKSLTTQLEALNEYCEEIKKHKNPLESAEALKNNYKRFIYTGSTTINTMRILAEDPRAMPSDSDEQVITAILKEFGIKLTTEEIKITKQIERH